MLKGTLEWHLNTCQRREPVTGAADRRGSGRRRWDNGDGQTDRSVQRTGWWDASPRSRQRRLERRESARRELELRVQSGARGVACKPRVQGPSAARGGGTEAGLAAVRGDGLPRRLRATSGQPQPRSDGARTGDPRGALAQAPSPGGRRGRPCTKTAPRWVLAVGEDGEAGVQQTGYRGLGVAGIQQSAIPSPAHAVPINMASVSIAGVGGQFHMGDRHIGCQGSRRERGAPGREGAERPGKGAGRARRGRSEPGGAGRGGRGGASLAEVRHNQQGTGSGARRSEKVREGPLPT